MTGERSEEAVLIALVVSVVVHVGLMVLVEPQVMTRVVPAEIKAHRRVAMHVVEKPPRPDPVSIDEVDDLKARKDAPAVEGERSAPMAEAPSSSIPEVDMPELEVPEPSVKVSAAVPVMDAKPVGVGSGAVTAVMPITRIETPDMANEKTEKPEFSMKMPEVVKEASPLLVESPGRAPASVFLPVKKAGSDKEGEDRVKFTPAREVYEKVDEKIVIEEKAAVRRLVDSVTAADLTKCVNIEMKTATSGGWRYFKVVMTQKPSSPLKTVPKDVVMIIDGSGSIGKDRFGSCRKAARGILRSCTNTGDRFNLVVFRNAFSYAFRNWRECDAESFEAGDKWLSRQTAHGRTDVFSTISSVLTLPRDPKRPLIAMVVTDGDANYGVSDTAEILSKFTALNDGLVSVYMYGVKSSANRELIDVLTRGNRGESFIFDGWWRWDAGSGMEGLSERFRDPVLSDLRVVFASNSQAEAYPRLLRNLYAGGSVEFTGRVSASAKEVAFSIKGINGPEAYEGFFKLPFAAAAVAETIPAEWNAELAIDRKLGRR
ncbi:MAG: VWA domain-containing protein [Kiritimatiellae bacterium]|nr:VWA domain-containing protein [Kiritimatiellia bacterium]